MIPWYLMAKGKGGGYKTASGPIVSVSDALAAPLRSLVASIDPVQDLHGYDSPWPAGGGKNLLDPQTYAFATTTLNGVTYTVLADGSISAIGISTGTGGPSLTRRFQLPAGTYSLLNETSQHAYAVARGSDTETGPTYSISNPFTTDGTKWYYFNCYCNLESGSVNETFHPMLVSGSTVPTAWSPYSNICPISGWSAVNVWLQPTYDPTANSTATIQLGQTVYGGTLDVTNGVMTVDMYGIVVDGTSHQFVNFSSGYWHILPYDYPAAKTISGTTAPVSVYSDITKDKSFWGTAENGTRLFTRASHWVGIFNSVDELNALGITVIYELATPITIPLTPTEISTLQGANNIWADSGDIAIEYLASGGVNTDLMKLAVAFMGRE